jgi:hypothetical protein
MVTQRVVHCAAPCLFWQNSLHHAVPHCMACKSFRNALRATHVAT